jgi:hypothetical protein
MVDAFDIAVPKTHLMAWRVGDPIPSGIFILVGIMVGWNKYDQQLAVALDEAVEDGRTGVDLVAAFAADRFTSIDELRLVFPDLRCSQSPYLGLWEDRRLRLCDTAASATAFLADRYALALS